jgi:hypothetical protein
MTNRREFIRACAAATLAGGQVAAEPDRRPAATRAVVLLPEDLSLSDWPERANKAELTTIALHHQNSPQAVIRWVKSDAGHRFLRQCRKLGLQVEYELHAMKELLPRDLFAKQPELFRMDDKGRRTADANCCVHCEPALALMAENAVAIAKTLKPTTGRYFYWGDDAQPWCHCPKCRELSPSDQALIVENRLCQALKKVDAEAQVSHLAYLNTMTAPKKVKPEMGVFLEYAPINRCYDVPLEQQKDLAEGLAALDANLEVFPKETAQVLEYWLDVSRFSKWKRPAVQLPWKKEVVAADVRTFKKRGIRHLTTFAAWVDADYQKRFGDLDFISEYGQELRRGAE